MRVGFDDRAGVIVIVGGGVFPPLTLSAHLRDDGQIRVHSLAAQSELLCPWEALATLDGETFPTPDAAMAYLEGVFATRPPAEAVTAVAGADLPAGLPVCISRLDGTLIPARADTYTQAFVIGLVRAPVEAGFVGSACFAPCTLDDWTPIAGTPSLTTGLPYFLGATGGITASPDLSAGRCLVRIGNATGPQTLAPVQADPIQL